MPIYSVCLLFRHVPPAGICILLAGIMGRGFIVVVLIAALVAVLLLVTFDLDRPTRGLITVPSTPLQSLRASMELPPAASPPP